MKLLPFFLVACASPKPAPPVVNVPPPPAKSEPAIHGQLIGTVHRQPFEAWSALMVFTNHTRYSCVSKTPGAPCTRLEWVASKLQIFHRKVSCDELEGPANRYRMFKPLADERWIDIEFQGIWPLSPKTVRTTPSNDGAVTGKYIHVSLTKRMGEEGSSGGSGEIYGRLEFLETTPTSGVIVIDFKTDYQDGTKDDAVKGTIPFVVCP